MNRKRTMAVLLVIGLIFAGYLFWPTDESRIRKLISEGAKATESADVDGLMARISFNYRDDYGTTYLTVRELLKRELPRLSNISVEYENLKIKVSENTATAELDVRVVATSGSETGYIVGDIRDPLSLKLTLDKERTKWLVVKAEGFRDQRIRRSAR
jgi:hypothetical protein